MRWWPALLTLAFCGCAAGQPAVPRAGERPLRVMSINQCTDQLVLALLPPDRIASVTWLSRDPGGSLMAAAARRVSVNRGTAEEVLAQRPDLVIAGSFTTPALRSMLRRLGYPLLEVDHASDIPGVRRITRQVAAAVGERARGEAMIADMDRKLAGLSRNPIAPIRVAAWDRTGFAAGPGTLYDAMLSAAGARSISGSGGAVGDAPDIEQLLAAKPALLVQGARSGAADRGVDVARHRLVRRYWGDRTVTVPQAHYSCGTPMVADGAMTLRRELRRAVARLGRTGRGA